MGSEVLAQMTGGSDVPILRLGRSASHLSGSKLMPTTQKQTETYREGMTRLSVLQKGRDVASWALTILEDQRPTVAFSDAPETSPQLGLALRGLGR